MAERQRENSTVKYYVVHSLVIVLFMYVIVLPQLICYCFT